MFKKSVVALLMIFSAQVFAKGDQSGLLTELYNTKLDYNMYMNKGSQENANLSQMLGNVHANLQPYENQRVMMGPDFATPIRQTVSKFETEFANENNALAATFRNIDSTMARLNGQQKGNCDAVNVRYSAARNEAYHLWRQRQIDSQNLLNALNKIVADTEVPGAFYVSGSYLSGIQSEISNSESMRANYMNMLQVLDGRLNGVINDIRICYGLD